MERTEVTEVRMEKWDRILKYADKKNNFACSQADFTKLEKSQMNAFKGIIK